MMQPSDYADSAQARESDLLYQRFKASPHNQAELERFFAECNARREAESVASRARVAAALGKLEVFFSERE